jgi:hypothetical protein
MSASLRTTVSDTCTATNAHFRLFFVQVSETRCRPVPGRLMSAFLRTTVSDTCTATNAHLGCYFKVPWMGGLFFREFATLYGGVGLHPRISRAIVDGSARSGA